MIYIGSSDSEEIIKNIIKMWQNILKNALMYLWQKRMRGGIRSIRNIRFKRRSEK